MSSRIAVLAATALALCAPAAGAQQASEAFVQNAEALEWSPCPGFMPTGCELAVLHGNPSQPNADIFIRLPGRSSIPRHWHSSPERMVLLSGEMEIDYAGQKPISLTAGTYAFGPARKPHTADCRSEDPCLLFIAFEGPIDANEGSPQ